MNNLAKRAAAWVGWRWMPGMAGTWTDGSASLKFRVSAISRKGLLMATLDGLPHTAPFEMADDSRYLPDLTNPATLGCLLALVREAHGLPNATPVLHGRLWHISTMVPSVLAKSEAGVLVAALEAAS